MHLASNFVGKGQTREVKRWDKIKKQYVMIEQPEIVNNYNNGMGGVDLLDQLLSYYRIFFKSRKWTLRVIFHFIDLAVCASFIEYKKECISQKLPDSKQMKLLDFKLSLGRTLTTINVSKKKTQTKNQHPERLRCEIRPSREIRCDAFEHFPEHDVDKQGSRCKMTGCHGRSKIFCGKCDVHLCFNGNKNCFKKFHMS